MKPYSRITNPAPKQDATQARYAWTSHWLSIIAGASGTVLAFFWLVGFNYSRTFLLHFGIMDVVERPLFFTASVGGEQFARFCVEEWRFLYLVAVSILVGIIAAWLIFRFLRMAPWPPWFRLPWIAVAYMKILLALVLAFFVFGWLPLFVAQVQALKNADILDHSLQLCAAGGLCTLYRTDSELIQGWRITSDRDRIFVATTEGVRVIAMEQIRAITRGPHTPPRPGLQR